MADLRQRALLAWFSTSGRDLPWRRTRDPWAVLVAEVMLAQTQVDRVVGRYESFLQRFPTVGACAGASVGDVITAWAGLGYNRRAVHLHQCATRLVAEHHSQVPDSLDALVDLPGVGPYTARAVAVFAYERDFGVVDTNVARLLARWEGRTLKRAEAQQLADATVPIGHGWTWNQAMFDLGATVCTAREPQCGKCPVLPWCVWAGTGDDPAVGTAGTGSRQSRFAGSDRQGRGRLVDALRLGPVATEPNVLAAVMGWPDDPARAERVARTLVADGLTRSSGGFYTLP